MPLPDLARLARFTPGSLSPAGVLQLQRTVGNRAVDQVVQDAGPGAAARILARAQDGVLQRVAEPIEMRAFAAAYQHLLGRILANDPAAWPEVRPLWDRARTEGLDAALPEMWAVLDRLNTAAGGSALQQTQAAQALQDTMTPASRTGALAYTGISAGMFSPQLEEGKFVGPAMQGVEAAEKGRLQAATGKPPSDVDVKINVALQQLKSAAAAHRGQVLGGGLALAQTLAIFAGPEWYFGSPKAPYTREQQNSILQTFLEISTLYPDMLIMPGTIVSAERTGHLWWAGWSNVTNIAPVFWNGNRVTTIHKSVDCGEIRETFQGGPGELAEPTLFDIGSLKGSVEICVDHNRKRAAREVARTGGARPSFGIVAGAGQTGTAENSAVGHNGFVMSSDSTGQSASLQQVQVVAGVPSAAGGPEAGQRLFADHDPKTEIVHKWKPGEDRIAYRNDRLRYGMVIVRENATEIVYAKARSALTFYGSRNV